jgi:hypothetical protein
MFVILLIVYAVFVTWASMSCYQKMAYKEKPDLNKSAKKSFLGVTVSGLGGLALLVILSNSKDFHFDSQMFSNLNQMILLSFLIASVVVFVIFWKDSPSHTIIEQYQVEEKNSQNFEQALAETGFEISKKIECGSDLGFFIDMNNRMIAICNYLFGNKLILHFSDIIDCKIIENNNAAFTGDSRIFNIVKSIKIRIITEDVINAMKVVELIKHELSKDSEQYEIVMNFAQEVYSAVFSIMNAEQKKKKAQ